MELRSLSPVLGGQSQEAVSMTYRALPAVVALFCVLPGCTRDGQQVARNKEVVRRTHDLVWSKGNLSAIDELYAADFVCHFLVGPEWRGREGVREVVTNHRRSFPDWNEEIEDIIAEGDRVVTRFRSSGTHRGEFQGIPPTGRRVTISEVAIVRVVNGQIVEQWGFPDIAGLLQQLQPEEPPEAPK
jgi:steroid delta-isomerase-like uncharacterized protein